MSWLIRDCLRSQSTRHFLQNILDRDPNSLLARQRAIVAALSLNKWDEEILPSYKPESFYPAQLGETLNRTYKLITKIGFGTTSTVWLASDVRRWWQRRYVALKISVNHLSLEFADNEVVISKHISKSGNLHPGRQFVRGHIDTFSLQGPNGVHPVLVYDPMRETLYTFRERSVGGRFGPDFVKGLLRAILTGLDYLHNEYHVVHGDLNTENVMVPLESQDILPQLGPRGLMLSKNTVQLDNRAAYLSQVAGSIQPGELVGPPKIIDFSASTLMDGSHPSRTQLKRYKAPEQLLGAPWGYSADIWNLGLMTWELLEGEALLEMCDAPNGIRTEQMQLAEIIGLLGPPPEPLISQCSKSRLFFNSKGRFKYPELVPQPQMLEKRVSSLKSRDRAFVDFLGNMLVWDPVKRIPAHELLKHPWLIR